MYTYLLNFDIHDWLIWTKYDPCLCLSYAWTCLGISFIVHSALRKLVWTSYHLTSNMGPNRSTEWVDSSVYVFSSGPNRLTCGSTHQSMRPPRVPTGWPMCRLINLWVSTGQPMCRAITKNSIPVFSSGPNRSTYASTHRYPNLLFGISNINVSTHHMCELTLRCPILGLHLFWVPLRRPVSRLFAAWVSVYTLKIWSTQFPRNLFSCIINYVGHSIFYFSPPFSFTQKP